MSEFESQRSGSGILRPKARLLRTIGDELISSEVVAVLELVKNAYDADATRVLIRFSESLEVGQGRVEVIDNGQGMSREIIQNAWMEPATSFKKRQPRSEHYKRRVLGEKGIGRFAASKLANYLEVTTRAIGSNLELNVFFDWSQFDDDQKFLDQIQIKWEETTPTMICPEGTIQSLWEPETTPPENQLTHGTILHLKGLRSEWTEKKFVELRRGLARLISPFLSEHDIIQDENNSFQIYLDLPASSKSLSGLVETSEALRNPQYSIQGDVSSSGYYDLTMKLLDKEELRKFDGQFHLKEGHQPQCGSFFVDLRVWDRDELNKIAARYGSNVAQVKKDLDAASGVNIYRDGFRVLPYGESGNDWLQLNQRRVNNPSLRLSTNQIVGYVLISADENPELRDQSNREGIVDSQALDDLRELVIKALAIIEQERFKIRQAALKNEPKTDLSGEGLFTNFTLVDVHNMVLRQHPDDTALLDLLSEKEIDLEQRVEKVQTVLSQYFNLATLGSLVDKVLHEGRTPITKIINSVKIGRSKIKSYKAGDCETLLKLLSKVFDDISRQSDVMTAVFRYIEPFSGRTRSKPTPFSIEKAIANAISVLEAEIGRANVKVEIPHNTDTILTLDQADVQIMIINLMRNSLYWLQEIPENKRQVVIQVKQLSLDEVEILFSDSGNGVSPEDQEHIFEPYFSKRIDGTGLGLNIVGELVHDYYNGTLSLIENGPLPGATFRITLHGRR